MASFGTSMATSTKVNGLIIERMAMEFCCTLMALDTRECGEMTCSMVTAGKLGSTTQALRVSLIRPKSTEKVSMFGQMVQAIMETGLIIISKAKESING